MRIAVVQGTRPEIIKNYSIVAALVQRGVPFEVLHTNQHTERRMCTNIYREMGYAPTRRLPGEYSLGRAIEWLQKTLIKDRITHVVVNGDTAASLAGALAAMYLDIPVSHVEAGLRSGDAFMREERNRIIVDSIAACLFAYTSHEEGLLRETPAVRGRVYLEGNTTVDVIEDFAHRIAARPCSGDYVFVTLHRKELTDHPERLRLLLGALRELAERHRVIFPVHPRTTDALERHGLEQALGDVETIDPVGPFEALALQKHALAVLTDSGCIQEEAYLLNVPCVTLRDNTERHLTVAHRANVVTGFSLPRIRTAIAEACVRRPREWPDIYGSPGAGSRIVDRLLQRPALAREPMAPQAQWHDAAPAADAVPYRVPRHSG